MLRRSWRTDNNRTIHLGGGKWRYQMNIIVGLGNPGAKYAGTRHNVGFAVLDELAERHNIRIDTAKHKALIGKGIIDGEKVILAMPQTFMNLSGESVRAIMDFYKCTVEDLIVVYDGSQEFVRIRVGVGKKPDHMDLADYVLSRFGKEDLANIRESCGNACDAVETILADGTVAAMNKFN